MGIWLHNAEYEMEMGNAAFMRLRRVIADQLPEEFATHYWDLLSPSDEKELDAYNKRTGELVEKYKIDSDVVDFLYLPDTTGKVSYKVCRKLYNLIKDYDDNEVYGFAYSNTSFAYFKEMLLDCAKKRRTLYWS